MPGQLEPDLRLALDEAERELLDKLEESCSLEPEAPGDESTGELMRLEDALSSAARAAEQALQLRRRLRGDGETESEEPRQGVREFSDENGTRWRVWAVRPPQERLEAGGKRFLAEYREGWLAFEALDESARRRLPAFPEDWMGLDEKGLRGLLESATSVRPRLTRDAPPKDKPERTSS